MPRARPSAAQFLDSSAARAPVGGSDRPPVIRDRRQARQYNQLQNVYAAALAPYAASAASVVRPQYVRVPPRGRRRPAAAAAPVPVMALATVPQLPGALVKAKVVREKGKPTQAELKRRAAAKRVAEYRRAQPGPYAFTRNELKTAHELVRGGVRPLTTCVRQKKKTGNYDCRVLPLARLTLKDGTLGKQQYRMASTCKECFAPKSTLLRGAPPSVSGGSIAQWGGGVDELKEVERHIGRDPTSIVAAYDRNPTVDGVMTEMQQKHKPARRVHHFELFDEPAGVTATQRRVRSEVRRERYRQQGRG